MNIMILNCDFDESPETNGAQILSRTIQQYAGKTSIKIFNAFQNQFPTRNEIKECQGIIITGSKASVYEKEEWIENLFTTIKSIDELNIKCLGICFGFQAIAQALGGKVVASGRFEEGFQEIEFNENAGKNPVFKNLPLKLNVFQSHGDIVEQLPADSEIASKTNSSIQAFTLRNFTAVQFHPEVTPEIALKMAKRDGKNEQKILNGVEISYKKPLKIIELFAKS